MDELEIQNTFVKWLTQNGHYSEKFSDPNGGAGAMCDSVGTIDGNPILIEFKVDVKPSTVQYNLKTGSSLERKIRNTLEALSEGRILRGWDKSSWPKVWIVAERIGEQAREKLHEVLVPRSQAGRFTYEFGEWTGTEYVCRGNGPSDCLQTDIQWTFSGFPQMDWPGENRLPRRNIVTFQEIAEEMGVKDLFGKFIEKARMHGLRVQCNRDNLNLRALDPHSRKYMNVISVWPLDSGHNGLCVAEDVERLQLCFPEQKENQTEAPGKPAPCRGYMGQRRFLVSNEEIISYWVWAIGS